MGGAKNCPETPRQKMIGMMYLVLTAMLALNVSTDILNGFTMVDNNLHTSIQANESRNTHIYDRFEDHFNSVQRGKYEEWYHKAQEMKQHSDSLYNFIQDFKTQIAILADGKDEVENRINTTGDGSRAVKNNSNLDVTAQYAIVEGHGKELQENMKKYTDYMVGLLREPEGRDTIYVKEFREVFATRRGFNAHEGDSCSWEVAMFEGMPVGATMTVLTKIQSDIRAVEGEMIKYLMDQAEAKDVRVNKLDAYVVPSSNYVIRGTEYSARIILAGEDTTKRPNYYVNGQPIKDGMYRITASGSGTQTFKGEIAYDNDGTMIRLPFEQSYTVGEPSVTISNTDLKVLYRGYRHTFSISVPGVASEDVDVAVSGATKTQQGGKYFITAGAAKQVTITVSAKVNGTSQKMGSETYDVIPLPEPNAYFVSGSKQYQESTISRSALIADGTSVIASYGEGALLKVPFKVTSFKVNINGSITPADGVHFSGAQMARLKKLSKGSVVVITDIRAVGPDGEKKLKSIPLTLN